MSLDRDDYAAEIAEWNESASRNTGGMPYQVIDSRGELWTRCPPAIVVLLDEGPMTLPAGWKNGTTTYFSLQDIADAYGPLTLPDGTPT